ncbi:MAG: polyvinylalcohol dehydrogenase [Pedosphaera sp.]|nr:polyvinylalcohol dehydrogenase [Pedosphaera sp.]
MRVLNSWVPCALGSLVALSAFGADWPQWRGDSRRDHSPDKGLLAQWPQEGPKQVWSFNNAGSGYAGFAIAKDSLFTMGLRDGQEFLIAVDASTGKELWSSSAGQKYPNGWGDGPRMTPTVDGDRVFAIGGQGLLICVEAKNGKLIWSKNLVTDLGGQLQDWGYTESPLVVGDIVICTPGGPQGTLAGLDKSSGAVRWRTSGLTDKAQYSSPILIQHEGQPQVVQLVMNRFFGVTPKDGSVLWKKDFPGRVAVIPTPIYEDGIVYVTAGYGVGCEAVRLGTNNSIAPLYSNKVMKNHHGGVVCVDGYLYGHSDGAGWVCQELKTGKEIWSHKGFGKGSVTYADGKLICLDERNGDVALVEASTQGWKELSRFKLAPLSSKRSPQGGIWPHPVVVNGRLYLRDQELLHCFNVKSP